MESDGIGESKTRKGRVAMPRHQRNGKKAAKLKRENTSEKGKMEAGKGKRKGHPIGQKGASSLEKELGLEAARRNP